MSYLALFDSFANLLVGSIDIEASYDVGPHSGPRMVVQGGMVNAGITRAQELESYFSRLDRGDLDNVEETPLNRTVAYPSLADHSFQGTSMPLQSLLEEKFRNLTISLMSSRHLQPNESSPFYPPPTNVIFSTPENVYVYAKQNLWIAYGVALGLSLVVVIAGLCIIWLNGVGYSNNFSTVLRLARGAHIDTEIQRRDLDGRDPLPRYLVEASISFATPGANCEKIGGDSGK